MCKESMGREKYWPEIEQISEAMCVRGGCVSLFGCKIDEPVYLFFHLVAYESQEIAIAVVRNDARWPNGWKKFRLTLDSV